MADDEGPAKVQPGPAGPAAELRGATRLAVEGVTGVTDLVEAMHGAVGVVPTWLGPGFLYSTIRGVTRLVGSGIDRALELLAPLMIEGKGVPEREALLAVLNGVLGDHLAASHNPLAIHARLRRRGRALELTREGLAASLPAATGKVLVLVHGSAMSDLGWLRLGHDHGVALERDLGTTAVHLHYNSGLHISTNGRALCHLLSRLVAAWPVPIEQLVLLTHSMGGLVARSACHLGAAEPWLRQLRALVFLGTPHHGAPLERGGNHLHTALELTPYTRPIATLARIRSAGITDLRFGSILDEDWHQRDRFQWSRDPRRPVPLPEGVACYALAAAMQSPGAARMNDGIVPVDSALGHHHRRPELDLGIPAERRYVAHGRNHLDLLSHPEIYQVVRAWLE